MTAANQTYAQIGRGGWATTTNTQWIVRHFSTGPHRPRWKGRLALGVFYIAPGMALITDPGMTVGMKRVHVQRVTRKAGFAIETWWGQRA